MIPLFFRRLRLRRKPSAPAGLGAAGAAAAPPLPADAEPVLRDDMLSEVRARLSEQDRARYVSSYRDERANRPGLDVLERVRDGLRNLDAPVYGQKCVADVLAAEQEGRGVA